MSTRQETFSLINRAGLIVMALTLVDKLLALAKEMLVASRFGVSSSLDVFNVAYALPTFVLLFFTGTIASAFVPSYVRWSLELSPKEADANALSLIYLAALLFALLAAAGYVSTPILFPLVGHAFAPAGKSLGVALEQLLVSLIFLDGLGIILAALTERNSSTCRPRPFSSTSPSSPCCSSTRMSPPSTPWHGVACSGRSSR
jgi:putative peptidoglycan lipid II flippase